MANPPIPIATPQQASSDPTTGLPDVGATSSSSTPSPGYGLSAEAGAYKFDVSSLLPGLAGADGNGQMTGAQLLNAYAAAANSGDDQAAQVVAAVQHALYVAHGYYPASYVPTPGEVKPDDVQALAKALDLLYHANQAQVGVDASGQQLKPMGVGQFLAGAATSGMTIGTGQNLKETSTVEVPDSAQVAASYQKVAQQLLGHKPSPQETAAFVSNFVGQYEGVQRKNNAVDYQARLQIARSANSRQAALGQMAAGELAGGLAVQSAPDRPSGVQTAATRNDPDYRISPPSLADTMTLQDSIQQQLSQSGLVGQTEVDRQAVPDVGTAAENYARNMHPGEAAAGDVNNTFQTFLKVLAGNLGG